jgi:hypothetical protein
MAVVAVAGAGAGAISWLLDVPGASRTVLELMAPYSRTSLAELLGYEPDHTVNEQTAKDMAGSCYRRAVRLREGSEPVIGIGCTAAIATDRPRKGEHRCHVAAWTESGVSVYSVRLAKGVRDRAREDAIASKLVLRALAEACHLGFELPLLLHERERVETHSIQYEDPIKALLAEHVNLVTIDRHGRTEVDKRMRGGLLSGSFNPLHEGHVKLAAVASEMLGTQVTFELSITNVDKPTLEEPEVVHRVARFEGRWPVVVTRAVLFDQKARLFPGCTFVIGVDTAVRLVDARYYEGDESKMLASLVEIVALDCRLLVAGRMEGGLFHTIDDVSVPNGLRQMFVAIPESTFRYDLSSTELRVAGH